jgi:acetyltransferase-like isoleucine patch superfamily enzyme
VIGSVARPLLRALRIAWRRAYYGLRFIGRPIYVHPTSWVSRRSRLRVICGGQIVIGKNCDIHPFAMLLTHGGDIRLGDHCGVNPFTLIYGVGGATIGNGVRIAAHVTIIPENHVAGTDSQPLYLSGTTKRGIRIEDNVWIGTGVRVLDGVTIGSNAIVGAGSVVTRSLPPGTTAVGVPARVIKSRTTTEGG